MRHDVITTAPVIASWLPGSVPHVPIPDAQPGDLIFDYSPISHVGIYLGGGQLVRAPNGGSVVNVTTVNWTKVVGVGRPG